MAKYHFYYDESEHSRTINKKTITADEFYDGFIVAITGWEEECEPAIKERYLAFERKFLSPDSKELKSTAINPGQLRHGFASLNKTNLALIEGLLDILDKHIFLHYSYTSKVEFLVRQLLGNSRNFRYLNSDSMLYSITKALVTYRPAEVFESIDKNPEDILEAIRSFLIKRIRIDRENEELKSTEIGRFSAILNTINAIDPPRTIKWDYATPLKGFSAYLDELEIDNYTLTIDKEESTANTAKTLGFHSVCEKDSKHCFGIRIADMTAGLIAKLMKGIRNDLKYTDKKSTVEKRLLNERWFAIDNRRLVLYKSLRRVLKRNNQSSLEACTRTYSDDLVVLMSLADYFDEYESAEELSEHRGIHGERFNALACQELRNQFSNMGWPQTPLTPQEVRGNDTEPHVFSYVRNPPMLPLGTQSKTYLVLSVTTIPSSGAPLVTIEKESRTATYKLPVELTDWVWNLLLANNRAKLLPSLVRFQKVDGICRADIL